MTTSSNRASPSSAEATIRREQPTDSAAVRDVVVAAFERPDEADLVERLRRDGANLGDLSFVAQLGENVVGHIMMSRVTIGDEFVPAVSLAPVSVAPERQGLGIGGQLIRAAVGAAQRSAEPCIVLLGHADYYPRFGFEPAANHGIEAPWDVPPSSWMVHPLGRSVLPAGRVEYPKAFE